MYLSYFILNFCIGRGAERRMGLKKNGRDWVKLLENSQTTNPLLLQCYPLVLTLTEHEDLVGGSFIYVGCTVDSPKSMPLQFYTRQPDAREHLLHLLAALSLALYRNILFFTCSCFFALDLCHRRATVRFQGRSWICYFVWHHKLEFHKHFLHWTFISSDHLCVTAQNTFRYDSLCCEAIVPKCTTCKCFLCDVMHGIGRDLLYAVNDFRLVHSCACGWWSITPSAYLYV